MVRFFVPPRPRPSAPSFSVIRDLMDDGLDTADIAARYLCSEAEVWNAIARYDDVRREAC